MKDSDWLDLRAVYTVIQKYTQRMGTHRHTPDSHFLMHTLNCSVICVALPSLLLHPFLLTLSLHPSPPYSLSPSLPPYSLSPSLPSLLLSSPSPSLLLSQVSMLQN